MTADLKVDIVLAALTAALAIVAMWRLSAPRKDVE